MTAQWINHFKSNLIKHFGQSKGLALDKKYANAFPPSYYNESSAELAVKDILHIEQLSEKNPLNLLFYYTPNKQYPLHLRLFQSHQPLALSDILPMLENLDLRTYNEHPFKITLANTQSIWISDFAVITTNKNLDIDSIASLFEDAFTHVYDGLVENDGFNKLVLSAQLSWREITILRTYAKYLRQIGFRFSQAYIEKTMITHTSIAKNLISLFLALHDPKKNSKAKVEASQLEQAILKELELVVSLDEDRIIRQMLALIKSTLRTNYFQINESNQPKDYISIKLNSSTIPDLPLPRPLYEIFVYSPRFEGIHLRNAKVARGGIRWSTRLEDFRTEVLGLMKAQKVKNAVIVPSGAKGGFVLKNLAQLTTRESMTAEVVACYQSFISGLLDLTDNIEDKSFIRPNNVVCYDDVDPYLVVAADKGTATFSDIANDLAKQYQFWLGDAFASGGSTGYDHKKMGITARGAFESVKRHFRECDINIEHQDFTVVGIGDLSGDVFGNGMLYSKHIKLVGAFDHRHIFLDPDPDPLTSYQERLRIFNLPSSSWEDYNIKLLSKGGGVFKRSNKSISLSPQVKRILNIDANTLPPNELIQALLKAPVDLLFNGGIGTYVKSSVESHADVFDRTNDYCRVNGCDLRCKIVGEGGNLGFTQLGRVEYALKGGLINTDFIDNAAGVDCSDHEVNLKILLAQDVKNHVLSYKKRNALLSSLTNEVAHLVLHDNYAQALVMSFSAFHAKKNIGLHQNYIKDLENQGLFNRQVEYLPDDKKILERKAAGLGLTRPELAVLLAYTKIHIKNEILISSLCDDPYLDQILETAFPLSIRKNYKKLMEKHRLRRDIIATQLSNNIVNAMGITFVYRIQIETGASIPEIIIAYTVASHIFGTESLQTLIASLDFKISMAEQYEMLFNIRNLISLSSRWFLQTPYLKKDLQKLIEHFAVHVKTLETAIPDLMGGLTKQYLASLTEKFLKASLSKEAARRIAAFRAIYTALNIIDVATQHQFDLLQTAKIYFAAGERVNLLWFRDQIASDSREGHWNALARLTLRDELDAAQRALTISILQKNKKEADAQQLIDQWMNKNQHALSRWNKLLTMVHDNPSVDYSTFFIAIRELMGLIKTSDVLEHA